MELSEGHEGKTSHLPKHKQKVPECDKLSSRLNRDRLLCQTIARVEKYNVIFVSPRSCVRCGQRTKQGEEVEINDNDRGLLYQTIVDGERFHQCDTYV